MNRPPPFRRHKFGVAPPEQRRYNGVTYHSKTEKLRAVELDLLLRGGAITSWRRQVRYDLGPDFRYVADFVVVDNGSEHAEDVKGFETREFKRVRRLWEKYMSMPLVIFKRRGDRWHREIVEGKRIP